MHPRQKKINEALAGRDPRLMYEGKTAEEHAKTLTEATEAGKQAVSIHEAQKQVTEQVKNTSLKDKMSAIARACDGTRDSSLVTEKFDR